MSVLIISPSGNFYGSEQVLFDYLTDSVLPSSVAINERGLFLKYLRAAGTPHELSGFDPYKLRRFYWRLIRHLALGKYHTVYWNEAGHINYVILLSKLFPGKRFIVHVRIIEDTKTQRWFLKPGSNVRFISVSDYIRQNLPFPSILLYDPFNFEGKEIPPLHFSGPLRIGVIGRLTFTKGIETFTELFSMIERKGLGSMFNFIFYGEVSEDVKESDWLNKNSTYSFVAFAGFQKDRNVIYNSIDCVMHLSKQEALGRIFLEALDAGKPLIGMNAAGIGEVGNMLAMRDLLMEDGKGNDFFEKILEKLIYVHQNREGLYSMVKDAKNKAKEIFSLSDYTATIDKIISG
ncbi:glycosyltransferase [Flavihumibacter sp.]|uniref:glycosyltransferase n=1 Tax=Flavihumibacter sp. TaxID=1913981 RepID=UPI002FC7D201